MTSDDQDVKDRGALGPFARDAAATLDERAAAVRPDFAAMMARARAIAGEDDERPVAPVIPLVPAGDEDDAGLAAFTSALRGEIDAKLQARSLMAIPPVPGLRPRRRFAAALVGALAVAAALLLVVGGSRLVTQSGAERGVTANAAGQGDVSGGAARSEVVPATVSPAPVPEDSSDEPAPERPVVDEAVPGDSLEVDATAAVAKPRKRRVAAPAAAPADVPADVPAGPSLEEEAQALWQRGELAAAEQKFREILKIAGEGRRAELAYGDLFALTRQMRGGDGQVKVWREYLERFPRGRFAEDARAGLCQRAASDERAACWRGYLGHHPNGAHRVQAEAAGAGGAP